MPEITRHPVAAHEGRDVMEYVMAAPGGFSVTVLNYGGIIREICTPGREGTSANVVVRHRDFRPENPGYLGAITGRVAGRIRGAKFTAGGREYMLQANDRGHCLHGGLQALDRKFWEVKELEQGLELSLFSPDGENGFPGNVHFTARYLISGLRQLTVEFHAAADRETPVNLTSHLYFDLTAEPGCGGRQLLKIDSDRFGEIDDRGALTGHLSAVEGTPFDFRDGKAIQQDFHSGHMQIRNGRGYDHPFLLNPGKPWQVELKDPVSGRTLKAETTEPAAVVYSANHFDEPCSAVCVETQRMPDAVNIPEYRESVMCRPGRPYYSRTIWQTGVTS